MESHCVKDADRLAQMIILMEQVFTYNNQQAKEWLENNEEWINKKYITKTGKLLALELYRSNVNDWTKNLATEARR